MDNFYRRTVAQHPNQRAMGGLNTTVTAVLHVCKLPVFTSFVDVDRWDGGIRAAVRALVQYEPHVKSMLDMVVNTSWTEETLRANL